MYFYTGLGLFFSGYMYVSNMVVVFIYNVINSSYLQSRYDPFSITTIEFPNLNN